MTALDTPERLARFLTALDYPDDEVRDAMREHFPDCDVEPILASALEQKRTSEEQLSRDLDTEARDAEFNLDIGGPS